MWQWTPSSCSNQSFVEFMLIMSWLSWQFSLSFSHNCIKSRQIIACILELEQLRNNKLFSVLFGFLQLGHLCTASFIVLRLRFSCYQFVQGIKTCKGRFAISICQMIWGNSDAVCYDPIYLLLQQWPTFLCRNILEINLRKVFGPDRCKYYVLRFWNNKYISHCLWCLKIIRLMNKN